MADLFKEIIPSILQTKEYALLTDHDEKSYSSFMVNKALSFHRDTCLIANEVNKYPNLDSKLKYDFLLNMVRAQKRPYSKWFKRTESSDLLAIKEYYGYSDSKAYDALRILNDAQIAMIKTRIYKGD
jgi:hypothetical protein